jgi:uncharacterized delta-60 repeat protein
MVTVSLGMGSAPGALAQQADGKLLVGGSFKGASSVPADFFVARLNTDGSLDRSFNGGLGYVTADFSEVGVFIPGEGSSSDGVLSIAVQSDGAIIAGGFASGFVTAAGVAARFLSDGQLDVSYGTDGLIGQYLSGHGTDGEPWAFALTSDEKLALAGTWGRPAKTFVRLFDRAGVVEPTFGDPAFGAVYPGPDIERAHRSLALLVQPDNKLVVSAAAGIFNGLQQGLVTRINIDGSLDSAFGNGGYVTLQQATATNVRAMAAEPGGKILLAGSLARSDDPNVADAILSRLTTTGALDTTFGTTVINPNDSGTAFDFAPVAVLRAGDGRVIVVGTRGIDDGMLEAPERIVLVRLLSSPEITFQASQAQTNVNSGAINLTIRRIGDPNAPVSINYTTENGTAVAGVDYTSASGTLTWAAGEPENKLITIAINNNDSLQTARQFTVKLASPTEGYVSGHTMTVSIEPRAPSPSTSPPRRNGGGGSLNWLMLIALGAFAGLRQVVQQQKTS